MAMMGSVQRYVCLIILMGDATLLLRKDRPEWQKGRVNFSGGKIEPGETPLQAAEREGEEELGLNLAREIRTWKWLAAETGPGYSVDFFVGRLDPMMVGLTPEANDVGERFEWHPVTQLPREIIGNCRWLIPLALDPRADVRAEITVAGDIAKTPTWAGNGGRGTVA